MEQLIRKFLIELGEDPEREGLKNTPARAKKTFEFLTQGYKIDPYELLKTSVYEEKSEQVITVKDIPFYSLCEHHLLPFFGKAQVSYIPNGKIVGISKITQLVDVFARRLQLQERLTNQIAQTLLEAINPKGVSCTIEANHLCLEMQGEQKRESTLVTSVKLGDMSA
ncbi:MAG: GTP cyclohydrolase I FolE [Pseudomonadota bacterium]